MTSPSELWKTLKVRYGTVGLAQTFVELKSIMDIMIPNGVDLSPALDKIMSHYTRLVSIKWEIPEKMLAMMLLAKAPSSMETIVQMFSQLLVDAEPEKVQEEMIPTKVIQMMRTAWDTHEHAGLSQFNSSKLLNSVRLNQEPISPPQFQYQQQQHRDFPQQQRSRWGLGGGKQEGTMRKKRWTEKCTATAAASHGSAT